MTSFFRYWAKHCEVTGAGHGSGHMTNYSFAMLVIFYLQSKKIIPSVKTFQEVDGGKSEDRILGWNVGFCDDPKLLPKTENK